MVVQRRKYLGKGKPTKPNSAPAKSTAVAAFSPRATEPTPVGEGSGLKPAKVITRRSSRQSLAPAPTEAPKTPKKAKAASPAGSGTDTPGRTTRSKSKAL